MDGRTFFIASTGDCNVDEELNRVLETESKVREWAVLAVLPLPLEKLSIRF